jgi:formylglycine-generating enzyme required for sulfatase activity
MNAPSEAPAIDQANTGLYHKYNVTRTDGSSEPGGKHHGDQYFVLNLTTDKHVWPALEAYAESCQQEYSPLASDLMSLINTKDIEAREFVTVPEIKLPNGTVVPSFLAGKFHSGRNKSGILTIDATHKPHVEINYHDTRKACQDAGLNLVTELQYLAIAYDITQQDENWTGGKVGEGKVYQGLHKGKHGGGLAGNIESTDPEERRWHVLSNGERIYDFSGNVFSWVFDDVQGDEDGVVAKPFADDSPTVTTAPYGNREHGIGDTSVGSGDWSGFALVRGGYWGSYDDAGVFYLNHLRPGYDLGYVGFRCTKSL